MKILDVDVVLEEATAFSPPAYVTYLTVSEREDLEAIIAIIEASGVLTDDEILTVDDSAVATEEGVQAILDYIEESGIVD